MKTETGLILPKDSERVLVIMTDYRLGNFALTLPIIEAFAAYFEKGIAVVVTAAHARLVKLLPSSGKIRVLAYNEERKRRDIVQWIRFLGCVFKLMTSRYKTVISICYRKKSSMFALFTLAQHRIGLSHARCNWAFNDKLTAQKDSHKQDIYSTCLRRIGKNSPPDQIYLKLPHTSIQKARELIESSFGKSIENLAVIHPFAADSYRCWPPERFAEVADNLIERWNFNICLIGTDKEYQILESLKNKIKHRNEVIIATEPLDVMLALTKLSSLVLSNLSGPTHLVPFASDVPIICISGPTDKKRWKPLGNSYVKLLSGEICPEKCRGRDCVNQIRCVNDVRVDDVMRSVVDLMNESVKSCGDDSKYAIRKTL